ncbi:MAG: flagellar hook capping FlgD N-terminal domain-containing protein [Desulfosarcinaceae bacterium]|nr:flagellar hook capping FlgD N-terminal domain-containing protein [Desulfosarcinaceae bacterium]
MSLIGIDNVQSAAQTNTQTNTNNELGKDEFLTMLVAQLQYQDPMNPMDSTGFTAQLAQFSSLEQLENINATLETLTAYQAASDNAQAVQFIGKQVTAVGNEVELDDTGAATLRFDLAGDADAVYIKIYNAAGAYVGDFEVGSLAAGEQQVTWDGTDQDGQPLPEGRYQFDVLAVDEQDVPVSATTYSSGVVTGVSYQNGEAYLQTDSFLLPIGSVVRIDQAATEG